jgi:hypothetical protein
MEMRGKKKQSVLGRINCLLSFENNMEHIENNVPINPPLNKVCFLFNMIPEHIND